MKSIAFILLILAGLPAMAGDSNHKSYGLNMLCATGGVNNAGPGFGLAYERLFGPGDHFSLVAPLSVHFGTVRASRSGHGYYGGPSPGETRHPVMMVFAPGFRFYPARRGGNRTAPYAIGASLLVGTGDGASHYYTNGTNQLTARSITGFIITNAVSIHLGQYLRMYFELGLGAGSDSSPNSSGGPLGSLSMGLGGCW